MPFVLDQAGRVVAGRVRMAVDDPSSGLVFVFGAELTSKGWVLELATRACKGFDNADSNALSALIGALRESGVRRKVREY
jgi:hypothetical protein